jgi:hypothetical protein
MKNDRQQAALALVVIVVDAGPARSAKTLP